MADPDYFFCAVSTRRNLDLCRDYGLAGFPSTGNGAWAFFDISPGDRLTFLFGATAFDLYEVIEKKSGIQTDQVGPWDPIRSDDESRVITFPYRLKLKRLRKLEEPIARPEFNYLANSLLKRGGYRKTHFQADRATLTQVSGFPQRGNGSVDVKPIPDSFLPSGVETRFVTARRFNVPQTCQLREVIIQAALRRKLRDASLREEMWKAAKLGGSPNEYTEALGEYALEEGFADIVLKPSLSDGTAKKVLVEVKMSPAGSEEVRQLSQYLDSTKGDAIAGVLLAPRFKRSVGGGAVRPDVSLVRWFGPQVGLDGVSFDYLVNSLKFEQHL